MQLSDNKFYVSRSNKIIIMNNKNRIYKDDLERDFDYYFTAILPETSGDFLVADYSIAKDHNIIGFDLFKLLCPSLPDRYDTIDQYLSFAKLSEGMVAIDLGSYSGLGSIAFALAVGKTGRVIAVEPDHTNYICCIENIKRFNTLMNYNNIDLINAAVWYESKPLLFSGEGCLGSAVIEHKNRCRGNLEHIQGITLYDLTKNLHRLDFIKCDIEEAEKYVFDDSRFFDRFRPKIIIEPHNCISRCVDILTKYNYQITTIEQKGISTIPLLECVPL